MKYHPLFSWRAAGLAACCFSLAMVSAARAVEVIEPIVIGPIGPEPILRAGPDLSGKLSDLSIKPSASGNKIVLAGVVTLKNTGSMPAKAVAATIYLASSAKLSATDKALAKLKLASYRDGDGEVKAGAKVSIPLKYKLPKLLAAGLSGQYIIIVLSAVDYSTTGIVYGPLPKVP